MSSDSEGEQEEVWEAINSASYEATLLAVIEGEDNETEETRAEGKAKESHHGLREEGHTKKKKKKKKRTKAKDGRKERKEKEVPGQGKHTPEESGSGAFPTSEPMTAGVCRSRPFPRTPRSLSWARAEVTLPASVA